MKGKRAADALRKVAEDSSVDLNTRYNAVEELLARGSLEALPVLIDIIELSDQLDRHLHLKVDRFRWYAQVYLGWHEDLRNEKKSQIYRRWRQWWEDHGAEIDRKEAVRRAMIDSPRRAFVRSKSIGQ